MIHTHALESMKQSLQNEIRRATNAFFDESVLTAKKYRGEFD